MLLINALDWHEAHLPRWFCSAFGNPSRAVKRILPSRTADYLFN